MASNDHLLRDVRIEVRRAELRPIYALADERRRVPAPGRGAGAERSLFDFATVIGLDNLGQAVILRLLTPRGELAALGHPTYGSRLHQMIGRPNSANSRDLIKLRILESLREEARINKVVRVAVEPHRVQRDRVDVELELLPVESTETVTIGPFTLRLES